MQETKVSVAPKPEQIEDEVYEIRTCCGQISSCDAKFCSFAAKFAISSVVLGFSMVMLVRGQGDTAFYSSTVSLILGAFMSSDGSSTQANKRDRPK